MKNKKMTQLHRVIIILIAFVSFAWLSFIIATFFIDQQNSQTDSEENSHLITQIPPGELEMVGGQAMSSLNFNLDTQTAPLPPIMGLPLRTMADFATPSATTATIETNLGDLTVELYSDQAPLTVANFLSLGQAGFYDNLAFHRVEPGFIVQIGDPASRNSTDSAYLATLGTGHPGYRIADEINPALLHDQAGVLSMANINSNGQYPDSAGSQFFITLDAAPHLDGGYSIFGQVTSGLEILEQIVPGTQILSISF